jgi:hypothetical protein
MKCCLIQDTTPISTSQGSKGGKLFMVSGLACRLFGDTISTTELSRHFQKHSPVRTKDHRCYTAENRAAYLPTRTQAYFSFVQDTHLF